MEHGTGGGIFGAWQRIPLYARIVIALIVGIGVGLAFGPKVAWMKDISGIVLALLKALATPLILLAILHSILHAKIEGKTARKMIFLLVTNTMAAILIGLIVVNIVRPGKWGQGLPDPSSPALAQAKEKDVESRAKSGKDAAKPYDPLEDIKAKIPTNVVKPLVDDNVIAVILLGLTFGFALRKVRETQISEGRDGYKTVEAFIETLFSAVMTALHAVIQAVPIAVLCVVAAVVGKEGFAPFQTLLGFIVAVLIALAFQVVFYLTRVRLLSWVSPVRFLRGGKDAILTALSTASSTITMPITYERLKNKKDGVGLRDNSARLGALVGSNFNNDGTALYEAMAPLFVVQAVPAMASFSILQQVVVAFMAVVASVGAAGIPEAGLVTMLLVFKSVGLNEAYVLLLLPVDWFLDRCRTAVNVMGDMTVACCLDGKTPESALETASAEGEMVA